MRRTHYTPCNQRLRKPRRPCERTESGCKVVIAWILVTRRRQTSQGSRCSMCHFPASGRLATSLWYSCHHLTDCQIASGQLDRSARPGVKSKPAAPSTTSAMAADGVPCPWSNGFGVSPTAHRYESQCTVSSSASNTARCFLNFLMPARIFSVVTGSNANPMLGNVSTSR